jgi:hypothetical protein
MTKPTDGKTTGRVPAMDGAIMKAPGVAPKPTMVTPIRDVQSGNVLKAPPVPPKKK